MTLSNTSCICFSLVVLFCAASVLAQTDHSDLEIIQTKLTNNGETLVVGIATVGNGGNYKFECRGIGGSTGLRWVYQDRDGSLSTYATGSGVAFNLTNVTEADQGFYRCEKSGTEVMETIYITLSDPGIIPVQREVVVVENRTFSLSVYRSGVSSQSSSYIWQHNGTSLSSTSRTLTVSSANISHNGTYNCTFNVPSPPLGHFSASTFIDVVVFVPAKFVTSPKSQMHNEFSRFDLHCRATGNPPPVLSWNRNDGDISTNQSVNSNGLPMTESTFTVDTARHSHIGHYHCTASIAVDGVDPSLQTRQSDTASVTIHSILLLKFRIGDEQFKPANSVVTVKNTGTAVAIQCEGTGPLKWFGPNGQKVSETTSDAVHQRPDSILNVQILKITSFELRHSGNYTCQQESATNLEISILITMNNPAVFPVSPVIFAVPGSEGRLQVTVTGTPTPSADNITWYFQGSSLAPGDRHSLDDSRRTLVIGEIQAGDYGSYRCVVNTSAGVGEATVKLLQPSEPTAVIWPTGPILVLVGEQVKANCTGTGSGQLLVSWSLEGKNLPEGVTTTPQGSLTIGSASLDHSGEYWCSVGNVAGTAQDSVTITVREEPRILITFKNGNGNIRDGAKLQLTEGVLISFLCSATGWPTPEISWQFNNNSNLPTGVNQNQIRSDTGVELFSNALSPENGGTYSCVARNAVSRIQKSFVIDVQTPARVATVFPVTPVSSPQYTSYLIPYNHTGRALTCIGSGQPSPNAQWQFSESLKSRVTTQYVEGDDFARAHLIFNSPFEESFSGTYTCVVTNLLNRDSLAVSIKGSVITTPPPPPPPTLGKIVYIQLRVLTGNCSELDTSQRMSARRSVSNAVYSSISSLCACEFGSNQFSPQSLLCSSQVPGALWYTATITSTSSVPASTAYVAFRSWASSRPTVDVLGVKAQVDTSCDLLAESDTSHECPGEEATTPYGELPFPLWVLILLCVFGAVLLVLMVIVIFCTCYCCVSHKKGIYSVYGRGMSRSESFRGNFPHVTNPTPTHIYGTIENANSGTIRDTDRSIHHYDEPATINHKKMDKTANKLNGHVLMIGSSSEGSNPPASPPDNGLYSVLSPADNDSIVPHTTRNQVPNLMYNVSLMSGETSSSFVKLPSIPSTVRTMKDIVTNGEVIGPANSSEERLRTQANTSSNNSCHSMHTSGGSSSRLPSIWYHESADNIDMSDYSFSQPPHMHSSLAEPYLMPSPHRSHTVAAETSLSQVTPVRRTVSHQVRTYSDQRTGSTLQTALV